MAVILKLTGCMSAVLCYDKHTADLSHGISTRETATHVTRVYLKPERQKNRVESKSILARDRLLSPLIIE